MKILLTVSVIIVLLQNVNAIVPARCPMTNPELISCKEDQKIGQIINPKGCLIWTCVPDQPYCCPKLTPSATLCSGESSDLEITLDPITGCKKLICVPRVPQCCKPTSPIRKCKGDFYSGQVYDPKTGCLIWTCVPCPSIKGEGEKITCSVGHPVQNIGHNGCAFWTCPT